MIDRSLPLSWTVSRRNAPAFLGALLALLAASFASAQTGEREPSLLQPLPEVKRLDERTLQLLGSTTLVAMGQTGAPLTELALLQSGDQLGCWTLVNTDLAQPIPALMLARFTINQPLPTLEANVLEYDALEYALLLAAKNSPAAFQASALANRRVTYADLFQQPFAHRGQVVRIEGDVQWIKTLELPPNFKKAGLEHLYEVWIVNTVVSPTPYSVLLTELPDNLLIGQRLKVPVVLDAYFLKRRKEMETAVPSAEWTDSLLLVGRSLTVQKTLNLLVTAQGRGTVGAATLLLSGTAPGTAPLLETALLRQGERANCWTLVNSDVVRPIAPETLAKIKDGKTLPDSAASGQEFDALLEVLTQTWYTSPRAFEAAAEHDVSFAQLFQGPDRYRGKVVHIEGRLRLLQRWDPPILAREAGVPVMYEAAIFDDASGGNPYIVFVTDAPEGIPLNQKVNETVAFDGYFYKKWRYKALDSVKATEYRDAPLLLGRTLQVRKGPTPPLTLPEGPAGWMMPAIATGLGVLTVGVAAMFFMAFWLRKNDAAVQQRLRAARNSGPLVMPDENLATDGTQIKHG